jgi:hypothetical protein
MESNSGILYIGLDNESNLEIKKKILDTFVSSILFAYFLIF